jgi:hypothetical protein
MYIIVFPKDIRPGDFIFHNGLIFKVKECGLVNVNDNGFGAEVLVTGHYPDTTYNEFYIFQGCPLIKVEN